MRASHPWVGSLMNFFLRLSHPLLQLRQLAVSPVCEFLGAALDLAKPVVKSRDRAAKSHVDGQQSLIQVCRRPTNVGFEALIHGLDMLSHGGEASAEATVQGLHLSFELRNALFVVLASRDHSLDLSSHTIDNSLELLHGHHECVECSPLG